MRKYSIQGDFFGLIHSQASRWRSYIMRLVVSQLWNRKGKGGEVWIGRPGF